VMKLIRKPGERIARVQGHRRGRIARHCPGACITVPQAVQVRCARLE
jgi:hypothetical protein